MLETMEGQVWQPAGLVVTHWRSGIGRKPLKFVTLVFVSQWPLQSPARGDNVQQRIVGMVTKNKIVIADEHETSPDLRKAVEAIAIKPLAGKLTLLTRKLFNVFLAEAQHQGPEKQVYSLPLSKLCAKSAYESTNVTILKEQLRKMSATIVEWNLGVKGSRRWGTGSLVTVEIVEEGNRTRVEWSYPATVKNQLLAPEVYARMSLKMQNTFRSAAALALFEICIRYADSPSGLTAKMPWSEWRPRLLGQPDKDLKTGETLHSTYLIYKYFRRNIIKPAISEINDNQLTDIFVEELATKEGTSEMQLQFRVTRKAQKPMVLDEPNIFDLSLIDRLVTLGLSKAQAEKIYSDNDEGRVRTALDYTETQMKKGKIDSGAAYFRKALSDGYGHKTEKAPGLIAGERHKPQDSKKARPETGDVTQKLSDAWWGMQREVARSAFDETSSSDRQQTLDQFEADVIKGNPTLIKAWKKGPDNPMVAAALNKWLIRDVAEPSELVLLQFGLKEGLLKAS